MLDRLEQRILADTLRAAQHQGVIDLLGRPLHAVRQPAHDMCRIILGVDRFDMVDPRIGLSRFARRALTDAPAQNSRHGVKI